MHVVSVLIVAILNVAHSIRIGTLANHNPSAWTDACDGDDGSIERIRCNLLVYADATAIASERSVDLLVLPEAYGLAVKPNKHDGYFEGKTRLGSVPCDDGDVDEMPQQVELSCLAKNHSLALAANVFTRLSNGTRRITEVVFDDTGKAIAMYDKHHLFPIEEPSVFSPGPFAPTTFSFHGITFGVAICYEGRPISRSRHTAKTRRMLTPSPITDHQKVFIRF